jgi:hypothetical protein
MGGRVLAGAGDHLADAEGSVPVADLLKYGQGLFEVLACPVARSRGEQKLTHWPHRHLELGRGAAAPPKLGIL